VADGAAGITSFASEILCAVCASLFLFYPWDLAAGGEGAKLVTP
jgi:hypothetical protein